MLDQTTTTLTKPAPSEQVLSFYIRGWKTERDGQKIEISSADEVYSHNGPKTVSDVIEQLLKNNNLLAADIISITGDRPTLHRDTGSWDFWLFCRNPNAVRRG